MTESWQPQACRRPPPCCPRPADCSSPRSSHCGRCQSATGPPAPPSHLKEEETYTHRIQYQWVAITVCVCVTCTLRWLCPVGVWTWTCECKKEDTFFVWVAVAKNSSGLMYVQQMSSCIILTERLPWGSSSLRIAYARLSLPCCGKKTTARWDLTDLGEEVCVIMWWVFQP